MLKLISACSLMVSPIIGAQGAPVKQPKEPVEKKEEYNLLEQRFSEVLKVAIFNGQLKTKFAGDEALAEKMTKMIITKLRSSDEQGLKITVAEAKKLTEGKSIVKDFSAAHFFWSDKVYKPDKMAKIIAPIARVEKLTPIDEALLDKMAKLMKPMIEQRIQALAMRDAEEIYFATAGILSDAEKEMKPEDRPPFVAPKFIHPHTSEELEWIVFKEAVGKENVPCVVSPMAIGGKYIIAFGNGSTRAISQKEAKEKYLKKK